MKLLHHPDALGRTRRTRILEMLPSTGVRWGASEDLGRAGAGTTEQLAPGPGYTSADMMALRHIVASICYEHVRELFSLPDPNLLTPQVFPVTMTGSRDRPPHQRPHTDNHGGIHPLMTSVYYARIQDTDGGAVILGGGTTQRIVEPHEDDLIAFPGETVHAVGNLYAGERLSIVCNFYSRIGNS
jgi:2OG-Fe(II) oxygenase superfamily